MNNCRLLLLALVAVLQPIASFTQRNVFNGRHCCDRELHSLLRTPYGFIDGSFRSDKASSEERRINRNAIREINHIATTLSRQSAERIGRQILDSPRRLRTQYRLEKTDTDNERLERHFSKRNYRNTKREPNMRRLSLERYESTRNTINTRDVRNDNEIRRTVPLRKITRVLSKRERNGMTRREPSGRNVRRITRHVMSADRQTFLRDETRKSEFPESESLAMNRRSRENVIESRRSASLPNTRNNKNIHDDRNFGHYRARINFKQSQVTANEVKHRGQQPKENRIARDISVRRNLHDKTSTRNAQRYSIIQRAIGYRTERNSMIQANDINIYRSNTMEKRLVTRESGRRVVSGRTDRELVINQDRELKDRARTSVRRDYRDGSPAISTTHSTESTRDVSRTQNTYETVRDITREQETVGFRNLKAARIRENFIAHQNQEQFKNQTNGNWLNIFYTLQGIYLCGLVMQIINGGDSEKRKSRNLKWWTPSSTHLIKVE